MNPQLQAIERVAAEIRGRADDHNRLDSAAGDGDLGVTLTLAAAAVIEILPGLEGRSPQEILQACGRAIARKAPSTSGTLLAARAGGPHRVSGQAALWVCCAICWRSRSLGM